MSGMHGGATEYLGIWMAMMVPMMLPPLVPMLRGYHRSLDGRGGPGLLGLTLLAGAGYFVVWAAVGAAAYTGSAAVTIVEMRWQGSAQWVPLATGMLLLVAAGVQLSPWKARQLARCREDAQCCREPVAGVLGALRHGLALGVRCSLCCGGLMLALLAAGGMHMVPMIAATLAISAERLGRAPLRFVRLVGVAIGFLGVLTLTSTTTP